MGSSDENIYREVANLKEHPSLHEIDFEKVWNKMRPKLPQNVKRRRLRRQQIVLISLLMVTLFGISFLEKREKPGPAREPVIKMIYPRVDTLGSGYKIKDSL